MFFMVSVFRKMINTVIVDFPEISDQYLKSYK